MATLEGSGWSKFKQDKCSDISDVDIKAAFNPIHYGHFNKPEVMGGGRSAPPSYMAIGGYFQYSFLTGVLSWM